MTESQIQPCSDKKERKYDFVNLEVDVTSLNFNGTSDKIIMKVVNLWKPHSSLLLSNGSPFYADMWQVKKKKNFQHPLINPLTLTPTLQTIPMQLQQLY